MKSGGRSNFSPFGEAVCQKFELSGYLNGHLEKKFRHIGQSHKKIYIKKILEFVRNLCRRGPIAGWTGRAPEAIFKGI